MLKYDRSWKHLCFRQCVMQSLERRELFAADVSLLDSSSGAESALVFGADSLRPDDLLIYYGFPSGINATFNVPGAANEFGQYDYVVLGDCLEFDGTTSGSGSCGDGSSLYEHPDHDNTVAIISHVNASNTSFFGYIDLGVTTQNLSLVDIQQRVDLWTNVGVDGIFFDDFGYDFETSRQRQNDAVGYVHSLGLPVFANGFRPEDVLGDSVDAAFNPSGVSTQLDASDFYLFESFQVRNGDVVSESEWLDRVSALEPFRSPDNVGIQVMAITTNADGKAFDQSNFDYAWHSALISGYLGFGWGEHSFSSVTAAAPFRIRPSTDPGDLFLGVVENSSPIYTRDTNLGRVVIDTLSIDAGFNSLDFGDAPAPYATESSDDGARHIVGGPRLGSIDFELDGLPTSDANGDDSDNQNDEDGVLFGEIGLNENMAALNLSLENAAFAKADAWIDFNRDGDWNDAGEKILDDVLISNAFQTLNYGLPSGLDSGDTYARVRVSSVGGLGPTGLASDGEVEDYVVTIKEVASITNAGINEGRNTRSEITSIELEFSNPVVVDPSDFVLQNMDTGQIVSGIAVSQTGNLATLTFTGGLGVTASDASGVSSTLDNGTFKLFYRPSFPVVNDGLIPIDDFFRKYGDTDVTSNQTVGLSDFAAFRGSFGFDVGDAGFNSSLDANRDGTIDLNDFAAFRSAFGN